MIEEYFHLNSFCTDYCHPQSLLTHFLIRVLLNTSDLLSMLLGCETETCYILLNRVERTYLAEISNNVTSIGIGDCHDIEEKRINIEVEGFVIEEEFCQ